MMFFSYSVYCTDRERKSFFGVTSFDVLVLEEDDVWTEELKVEKGKCYKRKDTVQRIKILKKTITLIFLCNFAKGKSYFTD